METVEQLAEKAMNLSPMEKMQLVEAIFQSLDKPDPKMEKLWIIESEKRYNAYKKGKLEAHDWEEIKKEYER